MRSILLAVATTAVLLPTAAAAVIPAEEKPREFEVGAGLLFNIGGNFLTEADTQTLELDGQPTNLDYNGFAGGPSFGMGIGIDARWKGLLGLEIDVLRSTDGSQTENGPVVTKLTQTSIHVPVLLKGSIPGGIVRPNLVVGFNFIFPSSPKATMNPALLICSNVDAQGNCVGVTSEVEVGVHAESYTMFVAGLGFEFALPIENVDLRIPLSLRTEFNTSTPGAVSDRAKFTSSGNQLKIDYLSEYEYHAAITLGMLYHFL